MRGRKRTLFCMLGVFILLATHSANAMAASKIRIKYNGKRRTYDNVQVRKVMLDRKKIKLDGTNGILTKGSAMLSYKDVFQKGLKAQCKYSASKKRITISKNGVTITMTLGSKKAYVNGKKAKMPAAPAKVRYVNKRKTKILVPSRFVAENLGYTYTWYPKQAKITMASPSLVKYDGQWNLHKPIANVVINGTTMDSSLPAITIGGKAMLTAKSHFGAISGVEYAYDSATKKVVLRSGEKRIEMTIGSREGFVNGVPSTMEAAPWVVKFKSMGGKSHVMVPASFVAKNLDCQYKWDKVLDSITIQVVNHFDWKGQNLPYDVAAFPNKIVQCTGQYDPATNGVRITVKGSNPETMASFVETTDAASGQLYLDFPATFNDTGEAFCENLSPILKKVNLSQLDGNVTRLALTMTNLNYYECNLQGTDLTIMVYPVKVEEYSIQFLKPVDVAFEQITSEDLYEQNQFAITIPGNHVAFFTDNAIQSNNPVVQSIDTEAVGTNTVITVSTSRLQGYRLTPFGEYVRVSVGNPRDIYPNIVVLDAGHGGKDPGAKNGSVEEKNLNLTILYEYARAYFDAPDSPVKAYWTRKDDTFIELADRAAYADSIGADAFVSLHMNAFTTSKPMGTEVYYSTSNNETQPSGLNSQNMAAVYQNNLLWALGMVDRGVQSQKFVVVHRNTVPAILIELGFMSNPSDFGKLTDPTFQDQAAKAIYDSTVQLFNSYPTGR